MAAAAVYNIWLYGMLVPMVVKQLLPSKGVPKKKLSILRPGRFFFNDPMKERLLECGKLSETLFSIFYGGENHDDHWNFVRASLDQWVDSEYIKIYMNTWSSSCRDTWGKSLRAPFEDSIFEVKEITQILYEHLELSEYSGYIKFYINTISNVEICEESV